MDNYDLIDQCVNFLCSENGENYIKSLLLKEGPKEAIDRIEIKVVRKKDYQTAPHPPYMPKPQTQPTHANERPTKVPKEILRRGQTIQDWIKRVLTYLFENNLVSKNEIELLHDFDYSKETFGIAYPLLADNYSEIFDRSNKPRYWTTWKLLDRYYVCSQWWLALSDTYEQNINKWIIKILKI